MEEILNSPETKEIRQRMEEVRYDLDEDVQEIVEGARDMVEWRSYVRTYPWVCLGAALAAGYLIAPRRLFGMQPIAQSLAEIANPSGALATLHLPSKGHARGMLFACVFNLVMRGVSSFVGQQRGKFFAAQAATAPPGEQP